jgi:hypothetical protein
VTSGKDSVRRGITLTALAPRVCGHSTTPGPLPVPILSALLPPRLSRCCHLVDNPSSHVCQGRQDRRRKSSRRPSSPRRRRLPRRGEPTRRTRNCRKSTAWSTKCVATLPTPSWLRTRENGIKPTGSRKMPWPSWYVLLRFREAPRASRRWTLSTAVGKCGKRTVAVASW